MEGLAIADIIKIAAGSGVIAALINSGIGWLKDRSQRNAQALKEAEIEAILLISKLEALAAECARNYWEFHRVWSNAHGTEHERNIGSCVKPELRLEPASLSKIDRTLACRIAWIENDIKLGNDGIQARWHVYLDAEDALEADADLVGYFGYEALMVARALREKYNLTYQGAQWGMKRIDEQLLECSEKAKKFFEEND